MKGNNFVLVLFGVLHFLPQPCTAVGSTNDSRAPPWHSSHSATRDEEESQKTSSHPNRQKTGAPLSQHGQSDGNSTARQKVNVTGHAGPVLSTVEDIHREEQAFDLRLKNDDTEKDPIRSYPTGLTQSKKTMAFVNEEDGREKLKKTMAFWNVADGRSKLKKTMAVWDQTEGRWEEDVSPSLMKTQEESGIVSRRAHQVSFKETLEKGSIKKAPENDSIREALEKGSKNEDPEKVSTKEEPKKGYTKEAPEKGSKKEDPVKGSIKEEPAKGYIKEAPEKGFIKEAQEKGFINEAPAEGPINEAPAEGSINEAPAEGSINEAPAEGSINEAPAKSSIDEALAKRSIDEALAKRSIDEALAKRSIDEAPAEGSINEAPAEGSINEAPAKGPINEAPAEGSINEAPAKSSINDAPAEGSINEAPAEGSINDAPAKGSINEAPAKGSINDAPAEGSINEAPAEGSINEAPAEGSINEAPAEGSINEAPAEGSINEAPAKGSINETQEDHIHKDRTEKLDVLTHLKKDLGETHTAPQLPQKRQNEGGIVLHARKGQNEHEAVSAIPMKDRFENHPVSQHTQKDEKLPGNTTDQWRQDVTGKGTTSFALQQDQEGSDAVALSLKKYQTKTEPVPHIGKTHGHGNGTAFPPFGTKHSGIATKKATNEADTKQNPRTGRANESSSADPPPREKERTVVLEEGGNKMEAEMLVDSKAKPHKRAVYSLAVHRSERQVNNDDNCSCPICNINNKFDGDFVNIAYNKEAQISSSIRERKPCLLVNGLNVTSNEKVCIITSKDDVTAWIVIDLREVYSFEKLVVFRRNVRRLHPVERQLQYDTKVMWGLQASVDGDICYTWADYNDESVLPAYRRTGSQMCF
ncbi:nucleolar and coiled-body phosphoprotein 1-like [Littorina saxatilis]|uniref:nucleolar and coiled-body phosphoprotein 1-like n=1 Tax=Littorina saxatilis TaxID=31220 RepID=UPI0038B6A90D